jgi:hypothetical protein
MIVLGLAVPRAIDWYENRHALDIPRDFGVLPWLVLTVVGAAILIVSFKRRE